MRRTFAALALVLAPACVLPGARRLEPVGAEAAAAMAEAQAAQRDGGPDSAARARAACERALRAAPGWVAPQRMLDELLRLDLRALEALAAHRAALESGSGGAAELYLTGRLEGEEGEARFERAAALDPLLAWAQHGLGFAAFSRGDAAAACRHAARALELARDPWERTFFTASLARFESARGRWQDALARLEARAAEGETAPGDRTALRVQAVLVGLASERREAVLLATEHGLGLLRSADLTPPEVADLVAALRRRAPGGDAGRVALALAAQPGALRDRLRAEILLEEGPSPLALGLLERALSDGGTPPPAGAVVRAARFAAGDFRGAVERWLDSLPAVARAADGLPREARLRRIVELSRALSDPPPPDDLARFGRALLDAGWFRETRAVAATLARGDLASAAALDARGLAGQQFLAGLRRTLEALDEGSRGRAQRDGDGPRPAAPAPFDVVVAAPRTLDGLLAAIAGQLAQARTFLGGRDDPADALIELLASPRLSYGGLAEVVHPGPTFSAQDEAEGRGQAGEPVGGLAAALATLGRFGLFGRLSGEPADGTVLPLLSVEQRAGEHLGVRWHGSVAWCEGADVPSRAGRAGARIAGAALHEGYWVDVDQVRGELAAWAALQRAFTASPERVAAALAVEGLVVPPGEAGQRERVSAAAPLDEGSRVRLALLRERAPAGATLGELGLDELLEASAVHEEGHLCDRERFLPLARHALPALGLLLDCGLSPQRVAEELEYRAQLTALACARDPRLPLAQVLDGVQGGSDLTAHTQGYERLLADFLRTLDAELARGAFPAIARDRTLLHQLHRLSAEDVRAVATALARRKRML